MVSDEFKHQIRDTCEEIGNGHMERLITELYLALDQERPCDRAECIEFTVKEGGLVPAYRAILRDRYEEYDGDLMLSKEVEEIELSVQIAADLDKDQHRYG